MTTLADRTITALRSLHDELAALVPTLTDDQLTGRSGASEWTVAQVLSHLGSGGEITLATYQAALDGAEAPGQDFNESVWDRWNAMSPQEQAAGVTGRSAAVVEFLEALSPEQRETLQVKLGFMPFPLSIAAVAGMRLQEAALHTWDVQVGVDTAARVNAAAADVLIEQLSGELGFMLGFAGKADALSAPARVRIGTSDIGIVITDSVSVASSVGDATATFHGQPESVVRLFGGRLTPAHTPSDVRVEGNVSLEDLRRVFPGY